jgi:hypothetical protein
MKKIIAQLISIIFVVAIFTTALRAQSALQACPDLKVRITSLELVPQQPAQQHLVRVTWAASTPPCFTLNKFHLRGTVTFANGQTKGFQQTVAGTQFSAQFQVPGLATAPLLITPSQAPRSVKVSIAAEATAPIIGTSGDPNAVGDLITTSCLPQVQIQKVQAMFTGLVAAPTNGSFFPKVKVTWLVNAMPACYRIEKFTVTALLRGSVGTKTKTVTVAGNQTATEIVFDNFPVAADFTAGLTSASLRASGTARLTGSDQRELQLN